MALASAMKKGYSPMAISYYSQTINDNTKADKSGKAEFGTFEVPIVTLTPANVAATETLIGNFQAALVDVILGVLAKRQMVYSRVFTSNARASDILAQRENKWLCRYHDNTTQKNYSVSIPTAKLSVLDDGEEFMDLTAAPGDAFKTAFEALVRGADNPGNAITLDSVQFVGRNT